MMMENNFKKKILFLGGLCLLFGSLIVLLSFLSKTQVVQQRATGTGQMKFTLRASGGNDLARGGSKTIDVYLKNSGASAVPIFTAEYKIQFIAQQLTVDPDPAFLNCGLMTAQVGAVEGTNVVHLVCSKTGGLSFAANEEKKVGTFKVTAKTDASLGASALSFTLTTIPDGAGGDLSDAGTDLNLVIAAAAGGATNTPTPSNTPTPTATPIPACNSAPTGTNDVRICASPKDRTVRGKNNDPINTPVQEIWFNSGTKNVKYVKLILSFNHNNLNINGATFVNNFAGTYRVSPENIDHVILEATNSGTLTGRKKIAELNMSVNGDKPSGGVTYVHLCGLPNTNFICQKSNGVNLPYESEINGTSGSDAASYNLILDSPDGVANKLLTVRFTAYGTVAPTATVTPGGATNTPTPTTTPDPSQTATVNFKVKFQGISQKRADQKVEVRVTKGTFEEEFTNINMIANDSGVYSGSVVLTGVTVGGDYTIFVKGPKHLAKKFCVDAQESRCRGAGDLTLVAGANTFDFSKMALEGGDLPNPNSSGAQDGVCNSVDYSLAKNRLGSSSSADLAIADINLDGIVNAIDLTLIRNTLEVKYEEDF